MKQTLTDPAQSRHAPSHTQVPNCVFDVVLPQLNGVEAKLLFVVCRETFGWHRKSFKKSLTELERLTGASNQSVLDGLKTLVACKILTRSKKAKRTSEPLYAFNLDFDPAVAVRTLAARREETRLSRLAKPANTVKREAVA